MNLRERIADWISGGALTRAKKQEDAWFCIAIDAQERAENAEYERVQWRDEYRSGMAERDQLEIANAKFVDCAEEIIAQEKPTSNATVRRMARIARDATE